MSSSSEDCKLEILCLVKLTWGFKLLVKISWCFKWYKRKFMIFSTKFESSWFKWQFFQFKNHTDYNKASMIFFSLMFLDFILYLAINVCLDSRVLLVSNNNPLWLSLELHQEALKNGFWWIWEKSKGSVSSECRKRNRGSWFYCKSTWLNEDRDRFVVTYVYFFNQRLSEVYLDAFLSCANFVTLNYYPDPDSGAPDILFPERISDWIRILDNNVRPSL